MQKRKTYIPLTVVFLFLIVGSLPIIVSAQPKWANAVENHKWQSHPRLLFTKREESRVKKFIKTDTLAKQLYQKLVHEADSLLLVPVQEFLLTDGYVDNILQLSRRQIYRSITLSLAFRLTNDKRYLKKAEAELVNVCNYPNWNPRHYLDVAEMTTAVAISYDWLFEYLNPKVRQLALNAIKTKALDLAVREYEHGKSGAWSRRQTNWNIVCNAGMVMGAMAIAESEPELAIKVVHKAVEFVPNYLKEFAPDGVCFEGPAYWGYANIYLSLLLSTLETNFNQSFGLIDMPGIRKTVEYYMDTTSPARKIFNFANSSNYTNANPDTNPTYFYFSRSLRQPEAALYYRSVLKDFLRERSQPNWFFFLALPWFDTSEPTSLRSDKTLHVYKGINDIAVFKADPAKQNSIYLIAKGGDPDEAHQQMDVGTFIIESAGVRWSDDLGADSYDLPGFWDGKVNGKRWEYFKNSNHSHNTLSIDGKIQYAQGIGKIINYDDKSTKPYFTIDMTSAYTGQATSVLRTFTYLDAHRVRIQDDVKLNAYSKLLIWNMITAAGIQCNDKEAILSKDGKKLRLKIMGNNPYVFHTKVIPTPIHEKEYPVLGYTMLRVEVSGVENVRLEIEVESL